MGNIRLIYRFILFILVLLTGIVLTPLLQNGSLNRDGIAAATNRRWHSWVAHALGIRITRYGEPASEATLFVANHISWFDISALGSRLPMRFLSKAEVRDWPIVGWLATQAGTLYIKRGAHASQGAIASMADALQADQNVCLFAEGTTTDGNVRRFHGRLIQSAIDASVQVQPVALYYPPDKRIDGVKAHRDILYTGDTTMADSFLWVLRSAGLSAEVHFLAPIDTTGRTRDDITAYCEQTIRDKIDSRHEQVS